MPFFVVTIGTLSLYQGITYLVSDGQTTSITSSLLDSIGFGNALGIPMPVWIMIGTLIAAMFVLRMTYFGRDIYATGGNATAARLAGVNVPLTLMLAYAIAGAMAALAGVLQVAFISAASPVGSANVIFDATAAVLLGGTVLGGGVGGVGGTVIGVLFLGRPAERPRARGHPVRLAAGRLGRDRDPRGAGPATPARTAARGPSSAARAVARRRVTRPRAGTREVLYRVMSVCRVTACST